jgi:hypothetical protein
MSTCWKNCNLHELIGADYALRIFARSPHLTKDAREVLVDLVNEVRAEINIRFDECKILVQPGFSFRVTRCEECPFKAHGVRKCGEIDKWFDDFEIETGIPTWCPKRSINVCMGD